LSLRAGGEAIFAAGRIIVKKVKGFDKAREVLTRENYWESFTTPPGLTDQIKEVFGEELSVQGVVDRIIGDVRKKGDKALLDYTEKLDGVRLDSLAVDGQEIAAAYDMTDKKLISALEYAAKRIRDFHVACGHKAGLIPIGKHLKQQILP
jgi:histidinol dehydrogenase